MRPADDTIAIIDPAARVAETDCFNNMVRMTNAPLTYHLPALFGMNSLSMYEDKSPKGIIVLGSGASVYEEHPWQRPLEAWLMPHLKAGVPCLGICYGHQMLAHMFGGTIGFLYEDQKKLAGFRRVRVQNIPGMWKDGEGELVISHREHVSDLPPEFEVIATNETCPIDGFRHSSLPIFGLQSHPEATHDFMRNQEIDYDGDRTRFAFGHRFVASFLTFCTNA